MKNIYIKKDSLGEYQEFPVPDNLENYYRVVVQNDFEINNRVYNPVSKTFVNPPKTWEEIRARRDLLLVETDWSQLNDVPVELQIKYKEYRQDLRDITEIYKTPDEVIFPIKPE